MADTENLVNQVFLEIAGLPQEKCVELLGDLISLTVESSLHLPDVASLVVHDSNLQWIDQAALEPGKAMKVSAKSEDATHPIFDGEIVEVEPDFAPHAQRLVIRAFDRLHRLARGHHARSFVNVTDGDIVKKIAAEVGLQAEVGPTTQVHPYVFQNNQTNLEFLRERAGLLGYVLYVEGRKLHFQQPKADSDVVEVKWAATLKEFYPRMTTVDQLAGAAVRGWDPEKRQEIVGQAQNGKNVPAVGERRTGGKLAQDAFGIEARTLVAHRPIRNQGAADQLAQATVDRHASRYIEAEGVCSGNSKIVAGSPIKVVSVGDRFTGTYVVTSCRHEYRIDKTFVTHFSISGQNPATLLSVLAPPSTRQPNMGLVIGIVTDNQDPQGQGRVKVKYPWLAPDQASDWARVVAVGGGPERGLEFLPEINDEVLVGFELGDVHHPYVLGGLWNGVDKPPLDKNKVVSGGKVQLRVIRSRVGHKITIDDSDGGGGITIEDKSGNSVMLDTGSNSLNVKVQGNVKMEAQGNLTLKATGEVEISGMGVKIDGGAGMVEVKGSMINLN